MGTKINNFFCLLTVSILIAVITSFNLKAQENSTTHFTPKDLFGVHAIVAPMGMGVLLSPPLGDNSDQFAFPLVGGRVQVGWLLHKKSTSLPSLVVSYAYGVNQHKPTSAQLKSMSLLDFGAEFSPWTLYETNNKKNIFLIRIGSYVSMCSTKFEQDKTMKHRWGVARRVSLGYRYQMRNESWVGINLYNHAGHYFGKRPHEGYPVPMYTEELGVSFELYL